MDETPIEDPVYEEKNVNMKLAIEIANLYTKMMIDKTIQLFSTWCKRKNVLMLNATFTRKRRAVNDKNLSVSSKRIYVLKKEYLGKVMD